MRTPLLPPALLKRGGVLAALGSLLICVAASAHAQDRPCAADLMDIVCARLAAEYVEPTRLMPCAMCTAGLAAACTAEPRLSVRAERDHITILFDGARTLMESPQPTTLPDAAALGDRLLSAITTCGVGPERTSQIAYAFVNGALARLDAYTAILPPVRANDLDEKLAGSFGGIGGSLLLDKGDLIFARIRPGLPADRAGIRVGDRLVRVGRQSTTGMGLDDVVARIVGPPGTQVALTIERSSRTTVVTARRELIEATTLRWCSCGGIGYVRMDDFNEHAADDMAQALHDLRAAGPLAGLVLDLRWNGGGLVDQACAISEQFLSKGSDIVQVFPRSGDATTYATHHAPICTVPMVVLVSDHTASAAEILAGTLQCHGRALLAGSLTYGKGLIQTVRDLPDGSELTYSTHEYRLPDNVTVQGLGLMPDVDLGCVTSTPACRPRSAIDGSRHRFLARPRMAMRLQTVPRPMAQDEDLDAPGFSPDLYAHAAIDLLATAMRAPMPVHDDSRREGLPRWSDAVIAMGENSSPLGTAAP